VCSLLQGVIIRIRKGDAGGSFTVRRVAYGVGIERTFPMASPLLIKLKSSDTVKPPRQTLLSARTERKKARI